MKSSNILYKLERDLSRKTATESEEWNLSLITFWELPGVHAFEINLAGKQTAGTLSFTFEWRQEYQRRGSTGARNIRTFIYWFATQPDWKNVHWKPDY